MLFIAAGMGGGTGTGAAPVIEKLAREKGILTVGVVTKPFHFEGSKRMKLADKGIDELQQYVDTLLTIPNQNLFRIANEKTTFSDAFKMADDVLYAGVRGVTDLMVQPGMINLDFSDIKTVMSEMGKAMMGTGEASGEGRAISAAEAAIANPLIDDVSLKGARGLIINITGGKDITLYEVDEAANRIKQEVDENANIIYGTTCDDRLEGYVRVSIVATGIDAIENIDIKPVETYSPLSINNDIYKSGEENNLEINNNNESISNENLNDNDLTPNNLDTEDVSINQEETINLDNEENNTVFEDNLDNTENEETYVSKDLLKTSDDEVLEESEKIDLINEDINNTYKENDFIETEDKSNASIEPSVRRLSLFDNISNEQTASSKEQDNFEKSEPTLNENLEEAQENNSEVGQSKNLDSNKDENDEFDPEQLDSDQIDEEFNQETEEELLDIPTFLRRQAN